VIRELHPPPPSVAELEPAGKRRPEASSAAAVSAKHITIVMAAVLALVLAVGAMASGPAGERPRHRLAFDEPAPATSDRTVGVGESAAGVGPAGAVRPPDHIPTGWSWRPVGPLGARQGHIGVWTGTEVVYWGGDRPGRPPEGAAYDPRAGGWRRLSRSPLTNRTGAAAVWTGREVLVFGGVNGRGPQADGAAYDPVTDRWRAIAAAPMPGRVPLGAAWTGSELLVVGARGAGLIHGVADAAAYDPAADTWRPLGGLPIRINEGAAVWTGAELIVYGTFLDRQRGVIVPDDRARGAALDPATGQWRELAVAPLSGQSMTLVWSGVDAVGWDHDREAAAYDVATDTWWALPDLPVEGRDCLPRGVAAGSIVFATHCGQAALLDGDREAWRVVETPTTAVEAPVWTGDGFVQWLGPSGRPDDGTWLRPLAP
jgi:hypothetical protein